MIWYIIAALLVIVGVLGTILPALPGLPLVFAGLLLAAWTDGFQHVSGWTMGVLGVITALAMTLDFIAGLMGTMLGAAIGTVVGIFFGLIGLILGPFVGALIAELIYREDLREASKAGFGAWLGLLMGTVAKVGAIFTMLAIFASAWWIVP
jgi:uncharacterized protein